MKFAEFIQPEAIVTSLAATERDGAIRELVESLARTGAVDPAAIDEVVKALLLRENGGTTGFGRGVAAPHCKHPSVTRLVGTVGLSQRGIEFQALDQKPVYCVFVLLSPQGQDENHLAAMETVFRNLREDAFRRTLRQADSPAQVMEVLTEVDGK